ncbi:unnamed protein product, partial [Timema podura]|nr:unnamed protein product [Timema podura]
MESPERFSNQQEVNWEKFGLGSRDQPYPHQRNSIMRENCTDSRITPDYGGGGHQPYGVNELFAEEQGEKPWWKSNFFVSEPVRFGTWDGVFTSCLINIFGVIVFLRSGWIVGQAGVLNAVLMVIATGASRGAVSQVCEPLGYIAFLPSPPADNDRVFVNPWDIRPPSLAVELNTTSALANYATEAVSVALISVLSAVGICERCRMESGGVYFLVSHVLGSKFGGALGLLYVFGQAVGCALYVLGFGESMAKLVGLDSPWAERGFASAAVLLLGVINVAGVKWVIKLQFVLLIILLLAGLDFAVGSFVYTDDKEVLLLMGLYVSSMSSCLAAMYGTPRVLQSIANENVIPVIKILGKGSVLVRLSAGETLTKMTYSRTLLKHHYRTTIVIYNSERKISDMGTHEAPQVGNPYGPGGTHPS